MGSEEMAVYVLSTSNALSLFKKIVRERYGLRIPRSGFTEAICLAYTWSKFYKQVDQRYLECWPAVLV